MCFIRISSLAVVFASFGVSLAIAEEECRSAIQRLLQADLGVTTNQFTIKIPTRALAGSDSRQLYSLDWRAKIDVHENEIRSRLIFDFKGDVRDASVSLIVNSKQKHEGATKNAQTDSETLIEKSDLSRASWNEPHLLQLDLLRDQQGSFVDLNLFELVLQYLVHHSVMNERFSFVLNEPDSIQILNDSFNEVLSVMDFQNDRPRLASNEFRDPLANHYVYDYFQESYFPFLESHEFKEIIKIATNHLDFQQSLLAAFKKTSLGALIDQSGKWDVKIELEGFDLASALLRTSSDENPFVYRYRVHIRSRW
jgi:hypothetical protein